MKSFYHTIDWFLLSFSTDVHETNYSVVELKINYGFSSCDELETAWFLWTSSFKTTTMTAEIILECQTVHNARL
jgi:hypothetical protein